MVALGRFLSALATLLVAACNVPEPPGSSGGVSLQSTPCGRGVVVSSVMVSLLTPSWRRPAP